MINNFIYSAEAAQSGSMVSAWAKKMVQSMGRKFKLTIDGTVYHANMVENPLVEKIAAMCHQLVR